MKMSNLNVKTRGNSSPQGKTRVYLCCHPDDLENCLEVLGDDIFATQNCAIYYGEPDETELAEMRLFIVALTTRFLTKECRARSFEYGFAVEHSIPVLPVAMESGLDKIFPEIMNRIKPGYGDVQFLNRASEDATEIPYAEKLKKQLENILVGDELAERVRAAFDAYIFLSYRKKDRAEARDLMGLIHRIPFCRDIAIWYDEYLVPGEGWSDAIAGAMAKSALVVLAVTPSLTEPDNYIINHEYPDAKRAEKDIVPAELLPTDIETLKALFPEIPDTVDCHNPEALAEALRPSLQAVAIKGNETPEHDYLIGLAYLGGIDVERNADAAVQLITSAAERELPEAIKKLADMYQTGDGVERNYETAAEWLEKLVEVRRRAYEASGSEKGGQELFDAWLNSGDAWFRLGRIPRAKSVYKAMLTIAQKLDEFSEFSNDNKDTYFRCNENGYYEMAGDYSVMDFVRYKRNLSIAYNRLGDIAKAEGNFIFGKELYTKGLDLWKDPCCTLADERAALEVHRNLIMGDMNLGAICESEGKVNLAEWYYTTAAVQAFWFAQVEETEEAKRYYSSVHKKVGDIFKAEGNLAEAKKWYDQSLERDIKMVEETGSAEARRSLAISYEKQGDLAQTEGNLDEAKKWYEKGLALLKKLLEETGTLREQRELAICYNRLGDIARAARNFAMAKQWYEEEFKLLKEFGTEPEIVQERLLMGICYSNLGITLLSEGDYVAAKEQCKKGIERLTDLVGKIEITEALRSLRDDYHGLSMIAKFDGEITAEKKFQEKWQELDVKLTKAFIREKRELSDRHQNSGDYWKAQSIECQRHRKPKQFKKNIDNAREEYEKSLKMREEILEKMETEEALLDVGISYEKLGEIAQLEGSLSAAKEWYTKGWKLFEEMAEAEATAEVRRNLSSSYCKLGNIAKAAGDFSVAKDWYKKAMECQEKLVNEIGQDTLEDCQILYDIYYGILDDALCEGNFSACVFYMLKKAFPIAEILNQRRYDPQIRDFINKVQRGRRIFERALKINLDRAGVDKWSLRKRWAIWIYRKRFCHIWMYEEDDMEDEADEDE